MSSTLSRRRDPFFAEFDHLVRTAFGPSASTGYARQAGFSPAAEAHRDRRRSLIQLADELAVDERAELITRLRELRALLQQLLAAAG